MTAETNTELKEILGDVVKSPEELESYIEK